MRIDIDPASGVCFGVDKAIRTAEELLGTGKELYGLGALVHNSKETGRLEKLGLRTITTEQLPGLKNSTVLFRAHGEPPSSFELARKNHNTIVDATCPIVLRLQKRIRETYQGMDHEREQIVIFGKADHPETIGLMEQVAGDATVVGSAEDIGKVDISRMVHLFSQTTMDPEAYEKVESALSGIMKKANRSLNPNCTICSWMKRRKPALARFVLKYDVILFMSGKNSSNGKMLFEYCRSLNPKSYWISDPGELRKEWFREARSIGISGATSTPYHQLEALKEAVGKLTGG
ncbi:MAG: 4-hydroxy-3-methylbut-2-enyl diphosphate reductase [Bacteroidales bacterium]|nr:4-hydroxy-3-methylbut-2-enyl diphosphate reductase [Bacteroidales bacterium]